MLIIDQWKYKLKRPISTEKGSKSWSSIHSKKPGCQVDKGWFLNPSISADISVVWIMKHSFGWQRLRYEMITFSFSHTIQSAIQSALILWYIIDADDLWP